MVRWFDVRQEASGVIAIGQIATGVVAIGQIATGVVAVGQLARGVVVVGQLAVGVVSIGQLSLGLAWAAGLVGVGARAGFGWIVPLAPRSDGTATWRLLVLLALAVAYWLGVLAPLGAELDAILNPPLR